MADSMLFFRGQFGQMTFITRDTKHRIKAKASVSAPIESDRAFADAIESMLVAIGRNEQNYRAESSGAKIRGDARHCMKQCGAAVTIRRRLVIPGGANARLASECIDFQSRIVSHHPMLTVSEIVECSRLDPRIPKVSLCGLVWIESEA